MAIRIKSSHASKQTSKATSCFRDILQSYAPCLNLGEVGDGNLHYEVYTSAMHIVCRTYVHYVAVIPAFAVDNSNIQIHVGTIP